MKIGDWVILKHTMTSGTCIFPKTRRIKAIDATHVTFEESEFPKVTHLQNVLATFPTAREARYGISRAMEAWVRQTEIVEAFERSADQARQKRLTKAIEAIKLGASV